MSGTGATLVVVANPLPYVRQIFLLKLSTNECKDRRMEPIGCPDCR